MWPSGRPCTPVWSLAPGSGRGQAGSRAQSCEPVSGPDEILSDAWVSATVAGVIHHNELSARPDAAELPCVRERRLQVEAPIYQDAGNIRQRAGIADQCPLLQPGVARHIMGDDASERQCERGISVSFG